MKNCRLLNKELLWRKRSDIEAAGKEEIYALSREKQILQKSPSQSRSFSDQTVHAIYRELLSAFVMKRPCVAYFGPEGTFTHGGRKFRLSRHFLPAASIAASFRN
jgi:hypothetical protein